MDKDSNSLVANEEVKELTIQSCTTSEDHSSLLLPVINPSYPVFSNLMAGKIDPVLELEEPAGVPLEPNSGVNERCSVSSMPPSSVILDKKDASVWSSSNIRPTEPTTELTSARDLCIAILRKDGLITESQTKIISEESTDCNANHLVTCNACGSLDVPLKMLICDSCEAAFHLPCCIPCIKVVPAGEWYCQPCLKKKPKSLYGQLLEGKVRSSGNMDQRPHGMSHIEYMFKDVESYVTGVRLGGDFQAEVPEWYGPISRRTSLGRNPFRNVPYRDQGVVLNGQGSGHPPPGGVLYLDLDTVISEQGSGHCILSGAISTPGCSEKCARVFAFDSMSAKARIVARTKWWKLKAFKERVIKEGSWEEGGDANNMWTKVATCVWKVALEEFEKAIKEKKGCFKCPHLDMSADNTEYKVAKKTTKLNRTKTEYTRCGFCITRHEEEENVGQLKWRHVQQLGVAEMHTLRWICGHTRKDWVQNDDIRDRVGVAQIEENFVQYRLRWFGHIQHSRRHAATLLAAGHPARTARDCRKHEWHHDVPHALHPDELAGAHVAMLAEPGFATWFCSKNNQNKSSSSTGNWVQCREVLSTGDPNKPVICGKWRRRNTAAEGRIQQRKRSRMLLATTAGNGGSVGGGGGLVPGHPYMLVSQMIGIVFVVFSGIQLMLIVLFHS
ncbi:unnamed protein product [Triticum turgidum subsp. durum]|uniref:PHD-type domain-containing protein n=1 Tax=Triticum turgidum subsp. durum TaxID=4567 RepID=A0A9R0W099_TRITD|nr:unnamed protein product [Triticum turgidum subsp. durum]